MLFYTVEIIPVKKDLRYKKFKIINPQMCLIYLKRDTLCKLPQFYVICDPIILK